MRIPSVDQFHSFYDDTLKSELIETDKLRKRIIINYSIIGTVVFMGFIFEAMTWMLLGVAVIVVFVFWYTKHFNISFDVFDKQYQYVIFSHLSSYTFPGSTYNSDRYIKLKDLKDGYLITGEPHQFHGKNLIEWHNGTMHIQISEISSFTEEKTKDGSKSTFAYFNGLACIARFDTQVHDNMIVVNESDLDHTVFSFLTPGIKHENHAQSFTSYYKNEDAFMKIFSPGVWMLIKNYCEKKSEQLLITVRNEGIYIGIKKPVNHSYVTSQLFSSAVTKNVAENYFTDLQFVLQCIYAMEKGHSS